MASSMQTQHLCSITSMSHLFSPCLLSRVSCPDYRLNPVLRKSCKADIPKFCQSILNKATGDSELEGQVVSCLKLKYADQVRMQNELLVLFISFTFFLGGGVVTTVLRPFFIYFLCLSVWVCVLNA